MTACPHCGAELEGLGTYCHACGQYTNAQPEKECAATTVSRATNAETPPQGGRQVLVLPLISQNRMWGVRAIVRNKDRLFQGVREGNWRMIIGALGATMHVTHDGRKFQEEAAAWLTAQRAYRMEGQLRCLMTLYLPRRVGDTDNFTKAVSDALEGPVVENDKQFSEWHIVRRYDKERPRCVVVIEPDDGSTNLDPGAEFQWDLPI